MQTTQRRTKLLADSLLIFLALLLFVCKSGLNAKQDQRAQIGSLTTQKGWQAEPGNPIIKAGDFMDKGLWNDPHVFKQGDTYIMYLTSSTTKNPFKPPVLPYRAVSKDRLNWKLDPEHALLDPSGTPFVSVETPSVVKFNGAYHMFYTGVYPAGGPSMFAIGHAVSNDGIKWVKDKQVALKPTGNGKDFNSFIVAEPGAVVYRDTIYVYFSAVRQLPTDTPPLDQTIGYVTTNDGRNFSDAKIALKLASTYPRSSNFCGYSTPMAVVHNDKIHLFHDVAIYNDAFNGGDLEPKWQQVALAHAVSADGGVTFQQDKAPIFIRNNFDWTGGEILAPSALFENGKVHLWFAGMVPRRDFRPLILRGIKGREFGIGYASIDAHLLSGMR